MAKTKFDAASYPYPECREQHVWTPYDGTIDQKDKLAYRTQKCANCPTKKHSVISMRALNYGETVCASYVYPPDYKVEGGLDKRDRGAIRMANFLHELDGQKK